MSKWMVSADELDSEQRNFIFNKINEGRNQWISGFPGSGKSVLLIHTLATIKENEPDASVLIIHFTHSLKQMYIAGINELKLNQKKLKFATSLEYEKYCNEQKSNGILPYRFDYILCDEVQDLTETVLRLMKENSGRLYIAGDPNQSIFERNPQTGEKTIDVKRIEEVTGTSEFSLSTIHRLTKSIIGLISSLVPELNILKAKNNAKKVDVTPRFGIFSDMAEEVKYVVENALDTIKIGQTAVIILPTHNDIQLFCRIYSKLNEMDPWDMVENRYGKPDYQSFNLYYCKEKLHYIGGGYGNLWQANKNGKVVLMTYHSAKGLDFDTVFLPFLDINAKFHNEAIFMVGMSRAKNTLTLTCTDSLHPFLDKIKDGCHDISDSIADSNNELDEFDF